MGVVASTFILQVFASKLVENCHRQIVWARPPRRLGSYNNFLPLLSSWSSSITTLGEGKRFCRTCLGEGRKGKEEKRWMSGTTKNFYETGSCLVTPRICFACSGLCHSILVWNWKFGFQSIASGMGRVFESFDIRPDDPIKFGTDGDVSCMWWAVES